MSVNELLNVMGCFRREGTIMSPAAAQTMLDNSFGIDLTESTSLGTLYNKNGLLAIRRPPDRAEPRLFPAPRHGAGRVREFSHRRTGKFFRDVVTNIYLDNIAPEIPIGGWIARHGLTSEQYQEAFNDYVGNHGMQLMDVSGYGTLSPPVRRALGQDCLRACLGGSPRLDRCRLPNHVQSAHAAGLSPCARERLRHPAGPRFACIFQQTARPVPGSLVTASLPRSIRPPSTSSRAKVTCSIG